MNNERILEIARRIWPTPAVIPFPDIIAFARAIAAEQREIDAKIGNCWGLNCAAAIRNQKVEG